MDEGAPAGTILVADDEPLVLNLAGTILRRNGYRVLAAKDGTDALALFDEQSVDLVLTDVVMPLMSGPQLMHKLRERKQDVRCIFMSGYTSEQIRDHGAGDPGCDYLRKPFTPATLLSMVRRQLAA